MAGQLDSKEMWFLPLTNEISSELGIRLFFPYKDLVKESETLMPLLYKMLDTIVGERSFALDIDYVDTDILPDQPEEEGLLPILELPAYIQWYNTHAPEGTELS